MVIDVTCHLNNVMLLQQRNR